MANHDFETQGELIINEPEDHWGRFDRRIADDELISIEARGVLAWIGTRPKGHRLFVRYLQKRCGLSQARWQRIRRELESHGYLSVRRARVAGNGKFTWQYHVNLIYRTPDTRTIGRFSTDGKSSDAKLTDIKRSAEDENNSIKAIHTFPQGARAGSGVSQKDGGGIPTEKIGCARMAPVDVDLNQTQCTPLPHVGKAKEKTKSKPSQSLLQLQFDNPKLSLAELRALQNRLECKSEVLP